MADIQMRFNRDMLVISNSIDFQLKKRGVNNAKNSAYINLMEAECIQDALRLNIMAGAQCVVANTRYITPARLAKESGMRGKEADVARAAISVAQVVCPQHILAEIGPCGLPLDASSKSSLNENKDQYVRAARAFDGLDFDAFFLSGFKSTADLKCALMGVAQVSGMPIFASVDVSNDASNSVVQPADILLENGRDKFTEALDVMVEFGSSVVGFSVAGNLNTALELAKLSCQTNVPVLVQLCVEKVPDESKIPKHVAEIDTSTFDTPDSMAQAALQLRKSGVQFLRAVGNVEPAHTAALAAMVSGETVLRSQER